MSLYTGEGSSKNVAYLRRPENLLDVSYARGATLVQVVKNGYGFIIDWVLTNKFVFYL